MRRRDQPFAKDALAFIRQHRLVRSGALLMVGVSGGPDSICLLHLLVQLCGELDISLHVAHLNHMLRGRESDDDANYVVKMAGSLGVGITVEEREVRSYRAQHHLSLEDAARRLRYQFFAAVADKVGAEAVAVGHTADDQVETVLMRLIRGAGTRGLQGMGPATRWHSLGGQGLTGESEIKQAGSGESDDQYIQRYWGRVHALEKSGRHDEAQQALAEMQREISSWD